MEKISSKGKILVVDDHRTVRNIIARALKDEGYQVATATDGEQALKKVKTEDFDMMFLDVIMPGISGLDVLAKMSKHHPETVVVILTAVDGAKVKDASFRHEAFAYMTKPCETEDIIEMAERLLGSGNSSQHTTTSH